MPTFLVAENLEVENFFGENRDSNLRIFLKYFLEIWTWESCRKFFGLHWDLNLGNLHTKSLLLSNWATKVKFYFYKSWLNVIFKLPKYLLKILFHNLYFTRGFINIFLNFTKIAKNSQPNFTEVMRKFCDILCQHFDGTITTI